jgi:hypothetical protein
MTDDIPGVTERLVGEFAEVPPMTVMEAVCTCSDEVDAASPLFVEQAARALLRATCQMHPAPVDGTATP